VRIAFFTETFLPATDGVVTRLCRTIEELGRMGDEVMIFAPSNDRPDSYAGAKIYSTPGITFPHYPQIRLAPPHPWIGRALREFRPDVIHVVNPIIHGPGGVYFARRMKVPLVCSYHTNIATYAPYYKLGFLVNFARSATRYVHNQSQINLCTSSTTMDYLLEEGIKRVRVWPQGVDSRLFHPDRASEQWRTKLTDGNPEDKLLLFVGRLAPEKHIERLRVIPESLPGTRLALVGDGPAREYLESQFAGTRTVLTGLLQGEDLAGAYASADAFLFPSTTETLGMAMIEALASGLPVVAARSGASHEVVSEGRNGLLYEPGSDAALVSAVEEIFSDEGSRREMSLNARAAAEERSWEEATQTLRGYYEQARDLL
jgi:glycosyltransferase involved in cell wall biosynthesis